METNGQGSSRLDRIEAIIERQVLANEAAHERFEAEDQRLLTAQILMNGALEKTNIALEKTNIALEKTNIVLEETNIVLEEMAAAMAESEAKFNKRMDGLAVSMEETTEKLNALIVTVDGLIRNRPQ